MGNERRKKTPSFNEQSINVSRAKSGLLQHAMAVAAHAAPQAAQLDEHTERLLQVATCMVMSGFGEAVSGLTSMARAFYGDAVLWAVHKGHRGPRGRTRLMYAAKVGDVARARFLLAQGAVAGESDALGITALMWASSQGRLEIVRCLVGHGADVNAAMTNDGMTALMWACEKGHLEIVRCLIGHGANVNAATTDGGVTALMMVCEDGHLEIVRCLVERGVNVNAAMTNVGQTALMLACHKGHLEIVRPLLQHGADQELLCHAGRTARAYAKDYPLIQALLTP